MNATAFGAAEADAGYVKITAGAITDDSSANASGTAGSFVLFASNGTTPLCAGTVGTSEADCIIYNTSIASGATVSATAFVIKLPKGWVTA